MKRAGIGPNENVYAELGSTWWYVMRYPTQAAHVLGKLLKHVGEDNVVWGTDCLFYGSPQDQIQAFRVVPDHRGVPGALRLPGAHEGDQGEDPRAQRRAALRHRPDHHDVRVHATRAGAVRRELPGSNRTLGPATAADAAAFRTLDHEAISTS